MVRASSAPRRLLQEKPARGLSYEPAKAPGSLLNKGTWEGVQDKTLFRAVRRSHTVMHALWVLPGATFSEPLALERTLRLRVLAFSNEHHRA